MQILLEQSHAAHRRQFNHLWYISLLIRDTPTGIYIYMYVSVINVECRQILLCCRLMHMIFLWVLNSLMWYFTVIGCAVIYTFEANAGLIFKHYAVRNKVPWRRKPSLSLAQDYRYLTYSRTATMSIEHFCA